MSVAAGEWASLCQTSPSFAGSFGVAMGTNGVTFWARIAPVTLNNVKASGDVVPTWHDVSDYVVTVGTDRGSGLGAESRWSSAPATIVVRDLDETLDFIDDDIDGRFAAGSLIQWGLYTSSHGSETCFTGYIDTIEEDEIAEFGTITRIQILHCFDTTYFLAGQQVPIAPSVTVAGTELDTAISNLLDGNLWPFGKQIWATTADLVANTSLIGNQLGWAHRFADSYGCRFYADRNGDAAVYPWAGLTGYQSLVATLSDKPDMHVSGHTDLTSGVPAMAHWSSSPVNASGRMYSEFAVGSPSGTLPRSILASDLISRKFPSRWDPPGWPKTDLLSEHNTTTEASIAGDDPAYSIDAMLTAAAPRYADDLCLDRLSIDTLNPKHSAAVWNFLMPSSASGKVSPWLTVPLDYQRRRYGSAGWLTRELMILGLSWTVDPKPGRVRLTMFTKNRAE